MGEFEDAAGEYRKAVEITPSSAAYANIGRLYCTQGLEDEELRDKAIVNFTKAVELDNENTNARYRRGELYFALGKYDECEEELRKVVEIASARSLRQPVGFTGELRLDDNYLLGMTHHRLGIIMAFKKKYRKSVAEFKESVRFLPHYVDAYVKLGTVHLCLEDREKAEEAFRQALRREPGNSEVLELIEQHGLFR
jgi:superkiller protein 3